VALALKIHRSTQGQQATEGFARRKMVSWQNCILILLTNI
jgi:hypothetical protein